MSQIESRLKSIINWLAVTTARSGKYSRVNVWSLCIYES